MKNGNKLLVALLVIIMVLSGFTSTQALEQAKTQVQKASYTPGTYTGTGEGKNGNVVVSVTFSKDSITDIKVVEQKETEQIAGEVLKKIPEAILKKQSTAVDVISGATITSKAIITAVASCIKQAGGTAEAATSTSIYDKTMFVEGPVKPDVVDKSYDIVVVGGGLAGMTTATQASQLGMKVLVLEKLSYLGGQGLAGEGFFANNTDLVLEATNGKGYDQMKMLHDVLEFGSYMNDATLLKVYIEKSNDNYKWIKSLGIGVPEVEGQKNAYIVHHNFQGHNDGGTVAIKAMEKHVLNGGGTIMTETPAIALAFDDKRGVKGVYAKKTDGKIYEFDAPAVVLCTGGFLQDPEMMKQWHLSYDRRDINSTPGHTGDGLRMAYSAGASDQGQTCIMMLGWGLWGFSRDKSDIEVALTKTGILAVNQDGVRFCNEDIVTQNYTLAGNACMSQHAMWGIFDDNYIKARATGGLIENLNDSKAGKPFPNIYKNIEQGLNDKELNVIKADTLDELAKKMGVPVERFLNTVKENNEMYKAQKDWEFGKDSKYLYPINKGPYYALYLVSNSYVTMGGLQVDEGNRVRSKEYTAIPHLYAAGTEISGLDGTTYGLILPGSGMGYCIFSGRNAADAAYKDWIKK